MISAKTGLVAIVTLIKLLLGHLLPREEPS